MIIHYPATPRFQRFQATSAFAGHPGIRSRAVAAFTRWRVKHSWLPRLRWLVLGVVISATLVGLVFANTCADFWRLAAHFPRPPFCKPPDSMGNPWSWRPATRPARLS
jgi:hypothetical protein